MTIISDIHGRQILDSRGNPTVEVELELVDGSITRAAVPSGASTGEYEAVEKRDGDKSRYLGKGVEKTAELVDTVIAPELEGLDVRDQKTIDQIMIDLDGTDNKSKLGANSILGVSLAVAKAAADQAGLELYQYIGGPYGHTLPVPCMNILNGGSHADSNVDIQEFMIAPTGFQTYSEALRAGSEIYHTLKSVLKEKGLNTGLGDEGGFAPNLSSNQMAFDLIITAIEKAGYKPGKEVVLAIDAAASEFYKDGKYQFEGKAQSSDFMIDYYEKLVDTYPLVSLEDPFDENDWDAFINFTKQVSHKAQIVGDDLFVTNTKKVAEGIERKAANAVLIKVNQIGTLTETLATVSLAQQNGFKTMISHRSGETEDTTIADLAVALNTGQIKTGAPARGERINKYNQLLRIEEQLGLAGKYAGSDAFPMSK